MGRHCLCANSGPLGIPKNPFEAPLELDCGGDDHVVSNLLVSEEEEDYAFTFGQDSTVSGHPRYYWRCAKAMAPTMRGRNCPWRGERRSSASRIPRAAGGVIALLGSAPLQQRSLPLLV